MGENEKRKHKRLDIDVKVEIERIEEGSFTTVKYMDVDVVNISKMGLAFRTKGIEFPEGAFFDASIQIWTKETVDTVFKVVRVNKLEDDIYEYGCIFVGMTDTDALKIQIYEMFSNGDAK